MNKKLVRLTESDLHKIVKKSLKRALSETADHNMAVDDKKYFDSDESWKAKKYQDERDKFLTNPNYVGTPSLYDPMNYREVEDFVDDEEDGFYKDWMDKIGYKGATNNDSIYNIKGDFSKLANKQREHLLNQQTKPWLHNESKKVNKKLVRLTEQDLHKIVKESVAKIINEIGDTKKGQDALGQVHGRALRRAQMLGGKGAVPRKLRKTALDATHKAYSEADKNNLFAGIGSSFDNGINTGYHKAKTNESRINRIVKESVKRILREGYVSNDGNPMVGGHYGSSTETGYTYLPWEDALYEMTQNGMLSEKEEKVLDKYFSQFEHEFEIGAESEYSWDESTNSQEGHITKFEDDFEHAMEFVRCMNHPLLTPKRKKFILDYFKESFYSDFDNPDYDSFTWEHPEDEYDDDPDRY